VTEKANQSPRGSNYQRLKKNSKDSGLGTLVLLYLGKSTIPKTATIKTVMAISSKALKIAPLVHYAVVGFGIIAQKRIASESFALVPFCFPPHATAVLMGATSDSPRPQSFELY
jgi:hypothetical protein